MDLSASSVLLAGVHHDQNDDAGEEHHAEVLALTGDSYRTRARRDLRAKDNRAAQG